MPGSNLGITVARQRDAQLAAVEALAGEVGLANLALLHAKLDRSLPYPLLRLAQGFLLAREASTAAQ